MCTQYIAVEGGVCSGKTTLCLEANRKLGIRVLPEYMDMLPDCHPAHSKILPELERLRLFFSLENARKALIQRAKNKIVGDRSVLSILSFEYALSNFGAPSRIRSFSQQTNISLIFPQVVLFLEISAQIRRSRWVNRGWSTDSIFLQNEFNDRVNEYFKRVGGLTEVWILDAEHMSIAGQLDCVEEALSACDTKSPNKEYILEEIIEETF